MNEQSYEEYIRSILGYPNNIINSMNYNNVYDNNAYRQNTDNTELEECYPEIYKIVYPMVTTACRNNTSQVTKELIENMTDEIYSSVENTTEIGVNITLTNEVKTTQNRNSTVNSSQRKELARNNIEPKIEVEKEREDRQFRNSNLRDLIKILLIRELIGRPGFQGGRPPISPRPPVKPPFPGGPGSGSRPPIMPRGREGYMYSDIYEN